jgi:Type I restriction modification DNA specificity domain/N-6 DNA Methylase
LKNYRQSILKYAFEGKLTEKWRKTNDEIGSSTYLNKIKEYRQRNSHAKYKEIQPMEKEDLSSLPEGWIWTRLGEIVTPSNEKFNPTKISNEKFIGLEHIESKTGKLLGFGKSSGVKSTKTRFKEGDVLYGKLRPYLNKVYVPYFEGVCSTDILVFSKNPFINNKYLARYLLTTKFVRYASQNMSGVQHPRVNYETISQYNVPLPPLFEQHKIVGEVEHYFSIIENNEKVIEKSLKQSEVLRQSILKNAFEGKLVSQDPTDEPASILLQKISNEKTNLELLRLPTGVFYSLGVKANVLFFDKKPASEKPWTEKLWIYDLRTNKHFTLKTNPLQYEDLQDFIKCYNPENRFNRKETERFKVFTYYELLQRDKVNMDIFWLKDESLEDSENLPAPDIIAKEIAENLESALEQFTSIHEDLVVNDDLLHS